MKRTATIEITASAEIEVIWRKHFIFLKKKEYPNKISVRIEFIFTDHITREKEKHLVYEGEMQFAMFYVHVAYTFMREVGWDVPSYLLPEGTKENMLRNLYAVLYTYQVKGWDVENTAKKLEDLEYRLRHAKSGTHYYSMYYEKWSTLEAVGKGEVYMGESSKYKFEGQMQIGQVGEGNTIHQLNQSSDLSTTNIDLRSLKLELEKLREIAVKEIVTADDAIAVGAIANAEKEAENSNEKGVLESLSKVGKWGLDIATKVGLPVAVEAIKKALGL